MDYNFSDLGLAFPQVWQVEMAEGNEDSLSLSEDQKGLFPKRRLSRDKFERDFWALSLLPSSTEAMEGKQLTDGTNYLSNFCVPV